MNNDEIRISDDISITKKDLEEAGKVMDERRWLPSPLPFLRVWRLYRGLTQHQLSDAAGLSTHHILNLERQETEQRARVVASDETIRKLMDALDMGDGRWFWEPSEFIDSMIVVEADRKLAKEARPVEDLKARRKAAGLSQVELALQSGVHVSTIRTADQGGRVSGDNSARISRVVSRWERS